jgi:hypothetical protein
VEAEYKVERNTKRRQGSEIQSRTEEGGTLIGIQESGEKQSGIREGKRKCKKAKSEAKCIVECKAEWKADCKAECTADCKAECKIRPQKS